MPNTNYNFEKSKNLFARSLQVAPGGVHSPVRSFKGLDHAPVFFERAEGPFLYSVDGNRFVDFCQSFGPNILGHLDPEVKSEVQRMVNTAWTFGACEPYSLELAEWIIKELPFVEKVRFVSSGTEAVMSALRVARAATGRTKILKFEGCYHGHTDSLLVKSGSGLAGVSASSSKGVPVDVAHSTLVVKLDDEVALEEVFKSEGKNIAAVIVEPLPANYGLLIQRPEFLKKIAEICKSYGSLLIFDEVISGFRVGLQGMVGETGIRPDLVTYGKIIGGGFPVGCYGGRQDLMDQVAPAGEVYQAGTLSANPIGMVAGLTTLKKMKRENGWDILKRRTEMFVSQLQSGFNKTESHLQVSSYASLFWIHGKSTAEVLRSIDAIPKNQSQDFKNIFLKSLNKGIYLAPNAYEVGFVSLAHSEALLSEAAEIILESIKK
jgi:glutamate-1-semialdehyde 2,1-aminomutase